MYKQLLLLVAVVVLTATDGDFANETENWKEVTVPCQEVEFVEFLLENIKNETRVVLADCGKKNFVVSSNFRISSIDKLRIHGRQSNLSRIHCTNNTAIVFTDVTNLHLENLHIQNCGWNETHNGGLKITNCTNVTLSGVTIENSWRTGLIMINVRGQVLMEYSNFLNNGRHQSNLTPQLLNSTYNDFHERGGGMQVMIGGGQANGCFTMRNCNFSQNSASHGGGLFLVIHEEAKQNNVTIEKTVFQNNHCHYGGGGGGVGYVQEDENSDTITNNSVFFIECNFSQNTARYGGGTAVFSTFGSLVFSQNVLTFSSCNWTNNSAILGLAMDISVAPWETLVSRRHLPSPVFIDCVFYGNADLSTKKSPFILNIERGILVVTKFRLEFKNRIVFCQNLGSAIEATSATLNFQSNSNVQFIENNGLHGAAMNLKASTEVFIRDNSFFLFKNNNATYSGGAIYVEYSDKHSFFISKSCFFRYVGGEEPKNVTFIFKKNFAGVDSSRPHSQLNKENIRHRGDSIFATSVIPCFEKCIQSLQTDVSLPITDTLKCIGQFSFDELDTKRRQISTSPHHFAATETTSSFEYDNMCSVIVNITNNSIKRNPNYQPKRYNPFEGPLHLIPGKSTKIPLRLIDDLCGVVFFIVQVKVVSSEMDSLIIHAAHSVVTDNSLTLYGEENDTGHIQLTTFGVRAISVTIKVKIDQCPPGYIRHSDNGLKACRCSSINRMNYRGIERCNESEFRAYVKHGYWVGYVEDPNELSLASALCPRGFCSNNTAPPKEHLLPANISEDISLYICNANRTGIICGSCKENHSAYYHSTSFYCGSNDLCHLGWLFYILSEIIPVTILFLVVIVFNISFTSGPLNGVIFFIQMIDTLKINAENIIWFDRPLYTIAQLYQFIFRMFSLNFFSNRDLSFCLLQNASAMDVLALKYITIIYSLLLVIGTVLLLKMCNFKLCGKSLPSLKGSIIHGLSGFLVMSYSECTKVSLMILTRSTLSIGPEKVDYVAFYNGDYLYMGPEHLKYAIPAIIFLQTMVAIPPLLLLTYPLCYKLFALLKIEESKCAQITCKIVPLEKTKPLFDSIQGAFKDRYRFFAGLYFLYRLCALLSFTLSNTLTTHYTLTGALLVFMLTIHATFCPYKKRWHNILDAILFCNLIIINTITHYNYSLLFLKVSSSVLVTVMISLQCVLILLPLVYLIAFTIYSIVVKTKPLCTLRCCRSAQQKTKDDSDIILKILDERNIKNSTDDNNTSDYTLLKDNCHR